LGLVDAQLLGGGEKADTGDPRKGDACAEDIGNWNASVATKKTVKVGKKTLSIFGGNLCSLSC
jgi:hypothetical protein